MIEAFQNINKAFESKVRLGIMAVLMVNEEADFNFLKEQLPGEFSKVNIIIH